MANDDEQKALRAYVTELPFIVGERSFFFTLEQRSFIFALQKHEGDLDAACKFVAKPMDWAQKFLTTRKFREFRNAKLRAMATRSGNLVDWWWEMGLSGAKGFTESYKGTCEICHEENIFTPTEAENFRQDDMAFKASCKVCLQPIQIEYNREAFTPSREQVQFWSELGNRWVPKIERVSHEFSAETFTFQTEDAPDVSH